MSLGNEQLMLIGKRNGDMSVSTPKQLKLTARFDGYLALSTPKMSSTKVHSGDPTAKPRPIMTNKATQIHSSFIELPTELRYMIYVLCLPTEVMCGPNGGTTKHYRSSRLYVKQGQLNIMLVCRLIRKETEEVMRGHIRTLLVRSSSSLNFIPESVKRTVEEINNVSGTRISLAQAAQLTTSFGSLKRFYLVNRVDLLSCFYKTVENLLDSRYDWQLARSSAVYFGPCQQTDSPSNSGDGKNLKSAFTFEALNRLILVPSRLAHTTLAPRAGVEIIVNAETGELRPKRFLQVRRRKDNANFKAKYARHWHHFGIWDYEYAAELPYGESLKGSWP